MPHFGHLPGVSLTTSGCIEQVYFCALVLLDAAESACLQPLSKAAEPAKAANAARMRDRRAACLGIFIVLLHFVANVCVNTAGSAESLKKMVDHKSFV